MKFKFEWWHGLMIAMVSFMIFIGYMVMSIEFSENTFDLVSDEYYQEEVNYQKEIDATKNTAELKEKPTIEIISSGIKITFPKEFNSRNTTGRFNLYRPNSKKLDIKKKSLDFDFNNTITIPAKILEKGNYMLKLYWDKDKIDYQMEIPVVWN